MTIRPFDKNTDQDAVRELWEEIHWLERDSKTQAKAQKLFLSGSRSLVGELDGRAECLVCRCDGSIHHLRQELPLSIIAAVTTSLVARKQALASRITARSIAEDAEAGFPVSALGMFEQGYYTRLGFGNGSYTNKARFSPSSLNIDVEMGLPVRLTAKNASECHQAMLKRWSTHGSVKVTPLEVFHAELLWTENPVGLGFRNNDGELTHFIWGDCEDENGPLRLEFIAYRNREQLLELLALIKSLGNQIYVVDFWEPAHVQIQDLLREPFRSQKISTGSEYENKIKAEAWWQLRINDVERCIAAMQLLTRSELAFNLQLNDPISRYLDEDQKWQGVSGDYIIHLGEKSSATRGSNDELPTLIAGVSGFSRLWIGAASATKLASCGEIQGQQSLLDALEEVLSLPAPNTGWSF